MAIQLILTLLIGLIVIKILMRLLRRMLQRSKINVTAHKFLLTVIRVILLFLLALVLLETVGIKTTSVIAALSVVGLAVSLAIQDSLANVMSGFILLLTHPFQINDYIQLSGVEGTVENISIANTKLHTFDNKAIYIPNSQITQSVIVNFTREDKRRLDLTFSISYQNDFRQAKEILQEFVSSHPLALKEPEPVIRLAEHGASALKLVVRVWVKSEKYWDLNYDLLEEVKLRFDEAGIEIPYEHLDVIVHRPEES